MEDVHKQGFLEKKGVNKLWVEAGWKKRYFRLRRNKLDYYKDEEQSDPMGSINLREITKIWITGAHIDLWDQNGRLWQLHARSKFEAQSWHEAILVQAERQVVYEGYMTKRGGWIRSWKECYFVLQHRNSLDYFDDEKKLQVRGKIDLKEVLLICPGSIKQYGRDFTIQVATEKRNWVFGCKDGKNLFDWINHLERSIPGARRLITIKEGSLEMRGEDLTTWKMRWFALCRNWLFYFESIEQCSKIKSMVFFREKMFNSAVKFYVKESINLIGAVVERVSRTAEKKPVGLNIRTRARTYELTASSETVRDSWFQELAPISNNQLSDSEETVDANQPASKVELLCVDEKDDEKYDMPTKSFIRMMDEKLPLENIFSDSIKEKENVTVLK